MKWCVGEGIHVDEKDDEGFTALVLAASQGHFATVQWLVEQGAQVERHDGNGNTALLCAAGIGHLEMVQYLVGNRTQVNEKDDHGKTALHSAADSSEENVAVVQYLLNKGLESSAIDKWGRTALHYASTAHNFEIAEFLLKECFRDSKPPMADLWRTLFEAAKGDRLELLQILVEYNVDVRHKSFQGRTALHEAAANGAVKSVEFLLSHSVAPAEADKFGATPVLEASRHGHTSALLFLLEAGGSIADLNFAGQTALHLAAQGGHDEVVDLMLKRGADIHTSDKRGWTPLHSAAAAGRAHAVERLVDHGAMLHTKTISGRTAEVLALQYGHSDVASSLNSDSEVPDVLTNAEFDKYKEYLLDPIDIHFNSITTFIQDNSEGSWLDAPIEVKLRKQEWGSQSFAEGLNRWSSLNHPHVLKLFGFCHGSGANKEPYFVYEHPTYESMFGYLHFGELVTIQDIWDRMYEAALGLQYLHDRNIVHGHVSSYSIAVASNGVAKLHVFDGVQKEFASTPETLAGLPPTFHSDVFAFGLVIVESITRSSLCYQVDWDDFDDAILSGKLPKKPECMTTSQWRLIEGMCRYDPSTRLSMADVVRELEVFSKANSTSDPFSTEADLPGVSKLASWADVGDARVAQTSVTSLLTEIEKACGSTMAIDQMNRNVFDRLLDIVTQLKAQTGEPAMDIIRGFGNILFDFHMRLETIHAVCSSQATRLAASSQGTDDTFSVHHKLDVFADTASLSRSAQVHQWRGQWELRVKQQQREMMEKLENLPALLEDVEDEGEREEVLTYLRFELSKHPVSYATSNATDVVRAKAAVSSLSVSKNPSWFIPAYEVKFDKFDEFSRGAFGKVYRGKWKGSHVVVKKVKLKSDEDEAAFLKEAQVWHKLYHPNVVLLYGACHLQKPFFVCEYAPNGQLDHYLRDHPDEVWEKLYETALGLRYLHVKRIVHGDLKCNNILVGDDGSAKLTDFGLSTAESEKTEPESELESNNKKSIGAIRWKAPEVLQGMKATFASDVYSFGMCIIEAVSGKYPWGLMMDPVVEYYVLKQKRIPQRPPKNCSEEAYALVGRMCRFDQDKRIGMNEVVDELKGLR
ncbi:hypothetical protein PHYPSEUDO_013135 [Phytophthora pseudosyringae]|uniref:Protein kinase domain-containing protein n=1 Tax=Phytophthora pseudosyringae TaxID=221518 RepID=A0A8T1V6C0_9STRA|nr:hypothetical protein PHYPSEUDO_013135 [Phytophthora pseudosyringae]